MTTKIIDYLLRLFAISLIAYWVLVMAPVWEERLRTENYQKQKNYAEEACKKKAGFFFETTEGFVCQTK